MVRCVIFALENLEGDIVSLASLETLATRKPFVVNVYRSSQTLNYTGKERS